MNRMTYFLISQRLRNGGKEVYRRRKSKFRTVINIIAGILAFAVLGLVIAYGGIVAILAGLMFFGVIFGFLFSMHQGKEMLLYECFIVKEQLNHDLPVDFNKRRVKMGFLLSFAPIYVIMLIASLIPGGWLWVVPYLPFFIICLILTYMSHGFVEVFNFSHGKYRLCHLGAHLFVLTCGTLIRELLIVPTI